MKRVLVGQGDDGPSHFRISLEVAGPLECWHQSSRLLTGPRSKVVVWEKFFGTRAVGVTSSWDEDKTYRT